MFLRLTFSRSMNWSRNRLIKWALLTKSNTILGTRCFETNIAMHWKQCKSDTIVIFEISFHQFIFPKTTCLTKLMHACKVLWKGSDAWKIGGFLTLRPKDVKVLFWLFVTSEYFKNHKAFLKARIFWMPSPENQHRFIERQTHDNPVTL